MSQEAKKIKQKTVKFLSLVPIYSMYGHGRKTKKVILNFGKDDFDMDINLIGNNYGAYTANGVKETAAASTKAAEKSTPSDEAPSALRASFDTIEKSNYTDEQMDAIDAIKSAEQQRINSFNSMIQRMIGKQANLSTISKNSFLNINITVQDIADAKAAISEGGEYSVNAVADRIMNMAIALSGGDESKIEELKAAVKKGFDEAEKQWGGALPSICGDTYTEIMNRFDKWQKDGADSIQ